MTEPVYAYSKVTDSWYRVSEYEQKDGDKIIAKEKREVDKDDVPQEWINAIDDTPFEEENE